MWHVILGTYMDVISWSTDEVWDLTLETRWETRNMELVTEAYTGTTSATIGLRKPLLPVWDYDLPPVPGLKAPQTRTRVEGLNEIVACTVCNGTGHMLSSIVMVAAGLSAPIAKGARKSAVLPVVAAAMSPIGRPVRRSLSLSARPTIWQMS